MYKLVLGRYCELSNSFALYTWKASSLIKAGACNPDRMSLLKRYVAGERVDLLDDASFLFYLFC